MEPLENVLTQDFCVLQNRFSDMPFDPSTLCAYEPIDLYDGLKGPAAKKQNQTMERWEGWLSDRIGERGFGVTCAGQEAALNIMKHYLHSRPGQRVQISTFVDEKHVILFIQAEPQSDQSSTPLDLREQWMHREERIEQLMAKGGRGMWIMSQYADFVAYQIQGREYILGFELNEKRTDRRAA